MGDLPITEEADSSAFEDQFEALAPFYDHLMRRVGYTEWASYLEQLFARHHITPRRLLDLACGTGTMSFELASRGYEVVGVDASAAMVEVARNKAALLATPFQFEVQLAERLDLGQQFDAIFSVFDSLNYILKEDELGEAFRRVASHLAPEGLFIFDLNTEVAFVNKLFNQDNLWDKQDFLHYKWRGKYDPETHICTVRLDFKLRLEGQRKQITQYHRQRAYPVATIQRLLWEAGLDLLEVYEAYSLEPLRPRSDRAFYVAALREAQG